MSKCQECSAKDRKIRILEADLEFETKKLKEDLAAEKVTFQVNVQRENRKNIQKLTKEKADHETDNKNWLAKYDQTVQVLTEKMESEKQALQKSFRAEKESIVRVYEDKLIRKQQQHTAQLTDLRAKYVQQIQRQLSAKKQQIQSLCEAHQEQMLLVKNNKEMELSDKHKQFEKMVSKFNSELYGQRELHQKYVIESRSLQTNLCEQIYVKKAQISDLKDKLGEANRLNVQQNQRLKLKQAELAANKQANQNFIDSLLKTHEESSKLRATQYETRIAALLQKQLANCEKYQNTVTNIEQKRSAEIQFFQDSLQEVKIFMEARPSRTEDTEQINFLRQLLQEKSNDYEAAIREAKLYRLELDNKESTYNRMFISSGTTQSQSQNQVPSSGQSLGKRRDSKAKRLGQSMSSIKDGVPTNATVNLFLGGGLPLGLQAVKRQRLPPKSTKFL